MPSPSLPILPTGMMSGKSSAYFLIISLLLAKPPVAMMTALALIAISSPSYILCRHAHNLAAIP